MFWFDLYVVLKTMCYGYDDCVMWFYVIKIYRKNFKNNCWQLQKVVVYFEMSIRQQQVLMKKVFKKL